MKKNQLLILLLTGLMAGCTARQNQISSQPEGTGVIHKNTQEIMRAYLSNVNKQDGISREEGVLIAQSELIFRGYEDQYDIGDPELIEDNAERFSYRFSALEQNAPRGPEVIVRVRKKDGLVSRD